jgi:hypothetical protein
LRISLGIEGINSKQPREITSDAESTISMAKSVLEMLDSNPDIC